jgi:hypothetical protein
MIITCEIFCMLDKNIDDSFKVLNNPNLTGWNSMMSIQLILEQLEVLYGQPNGNTLWDNNTLFKLASAATNVPKRLFHHINQCQEIAIIGQTPYTQVQPIANAVHLLLALGMFLVKEFEDWEAIVVKTWLALKTFVHGAYGQHLILVQLCDMSGLRGYALSQNMHATLVNGFVDTDNNASTVTIMQPVAAATTGSRIGGTFNATQVPSKITTAVNQLAANQTMLSPKMVTMLFNVPPPSPPLFNVQPMWALAMPGIPRRPPPFIGGG